MYKLLEGLTVIEATSFVASPSAGLYLAQLGAEVIRIDQIGGGPDYHRWPKAEDGSSFYWEGLNKSKKSLAVDYRSAEGRELVQKLATARGENCGILLTNFPADGFLSYETLKALRDDVIVARVMGQANGGPAFDYTVNCAIGYPQITGPASLGDEPVNHVMPAWDLLAGAYASFSLIAAERHRRLTGSGNEIRIPLTDLGIATIGNLGQIGEIMMTGENRPRYGNDVYGVFGRDFVTADGRRIMIMAISARQWRGLVNALDISEEVERIETARGVSFAKDEGVRFEHRDVLAPLVEGKVAARQFSELTQVFDKTGACWGAYQTMKEAVHDGALVKDNPIFSTIEHPSGHSYPAAGSIATIPDEARGAPIAAPKLGQDTRDTLGDLLGYSTTKTDDLIERNIVSVASE